MKRNWILFLLACLLFSFATAGAVVTLRPDVAPLHDGKIQVDETVEISILWFNDYGEVIGFSSSMRLYEQNGQPMHLQHVDVTDGKQVPDYRTNSFLIPQFSLWEDPAWSSIWVLLNDVVGFGWDGNLPDTFAAGAAAMNGWMPSADSLKRYSFTVQFQDTGTFCMDSVTFIPDQIPEGVWGWYFDDPQATFVQKCWQVYDSTLPVGEIENGILPTTFELGQNYPNPFNPSTKLEFAVPTHSKVNISIFNILGQKIATLVDGEYSAGYYSVDWDSRGDDGSEVASGIYFYKLEANNYTDTKKLMLIR